MGGTTTTLSRITGAVAIVGLALAVTLGLAAAAPAGRGATQSYEIQRYKADISGVIHTSWSQNRVAEGCNGGVNGQGAQRIDYAMNPFNRPLVAVRYKGRQIPGLPEVSLFRRHDDKPSRLVDAIYRVDVNIERQGTQTFTPAPQDCGSFDGGGGEPQPPDCGTRSTHAQIDVSAPTPHSVRWEDVFYVSPDDLLEVFITKAYRNCPYPGPAPEMFSENGSLRPPGIKEPHDLLDPKGPIKTTGHEVSTTPIYGGHATTEWTVRLRLEPQGK